MVKPMDDLNFDFEAEIDAKDALRKASLRADGVNSSENNNAIRGRRSQVCKHWLRNLCMKGDKCDYLHQLDPNKMPECVLWLKYGKCTDPDCVFRHVENSERPECQRYRLGFCRYGPMCRSRHDRLPAEAMPEVLPDWFIDNLVEKALLVPRAEDVGLEVNVRGRAGGSGRGEQEMGLSTVGNELGTIPGLLPPIHGKCRYFLVRSITTRNIQISAAKGIWASSMGNSQRLRQAFRDVDHVIVIFCASDSRNFSGYGKMTSEPDDMLFPGIWGEMSSRLSSNFRVHWIKQCSTPVQHADHIKHDDQPVRRCKDGQEFPSSVGERLCRFLWQQPYTDLLKGSELEFEPRYDHRTAPPPPAGDSRQGNGATPAPAPALALEDDKKDTPDADTGRARPAPEKIGSFAAKARSVGSGIVGKALASGSSSLAAALASEEARSAPPPGPPGPTHGMWPGAPPPVWGAPHWDPYHRGPPPMWHPPPHGYPPHHGPPGYYPPPTYGAPPPGYRPPEASVPPGCWGAAARGPPPPQWEGASVARNGGGEHRDRSRSRRRRSDRDRRRK